MYFQEAQAYPEIKKFLIVNKCETPRDFKNYCNRHSIQGEPEEMDEEEPLNQDDLNDFARENGLLPIFRCSAFMPETVERAFVNMAKVLRGEEPSELTTPLLDENRQQTNI